jgi:P27 family predicted phage terminase small subunit
MGLRGPKEKPRELKAIEGNRGRRPLNLDGIVRPDVEVPDIPKHLGKEARKEWKRISEELKRYNIISKLDRTMLGMLCQAVERLVMFETALMKRVQKAIAEGKDPSEAYMFRTPQGYETHCVEYQMLNKEREMIMRFLGEFGLSPAMRARVTQGSPVAQQLTLFEGGKPEEKAKDGPQSFSEF